MKRSVFITILLSFFLLEFTNAQCITGNCYNGKGIHKYDSGARYEGEFKNGQRHGMGTCFYSNGNRYVGYWSEDRPNAQGTMYYTNGIVESGNWINGKLEGQEIDFPQPNIPSPDTKKDGCVEGDCQNGNGKWVYDNGDTYEGEFKDGDCHGNGRYSFQNGVVYEGAFANNDFNGYGTASYPSGRSLTGNWLDGEYVGIEMPESVVDIVDESVSHPKGDQDTQGAEVITTIKGGDFSEEHNHPEDIKVWAVVIGVSNYSAMPRLNYTDDDAYQVFAFLKSPEGGALPDNQIRVLIDESATKEKIETTLREVFTQADENDVIFMYFSGHGIKGSFLPIDYDGKQQVVKHEDVRAIFNESKAKYKLCIADACHSGSLTKTRSLKSINMTIQTYYEAFKYSRGGLALFMSSKAEEISLESNGLRQGIFSHFLIRGLKGEADTNNNNIVTVEELYDFVSFGVKDFTVSYQTPIISGDYDPNMPIGVIRK